MEKVAKVILITIGIFLIVNGVLNIIDDATILTYDITSILSGIGFLVVGLFKKE